MNRYKKYLNRISITPVNNTYTNKFLNAIQGLIIELKENPLKVTPIVDRPWFIPSNHNTIGPYLKIVKSLAMLCKVKLMYRNMIEIDISIPKKGFWVIGEKDRVELFIFVAEHFFEKHLEYKRWISKNRKAEANSLKYKDIRVFSSKLSKLQLDTITKYINEILEPDRLYDIHLENYIKERYKLDFKKYKTYHREYYHAISNKFFHKRMLL